MPLTPSLRSRAREVTISGPDGYRHGPFPGTYGTSGTEKACAFIENGCYSVDISACVWSEEATWTLGEGNPVEMGCGQIVYYAITGAGTDSIAASRAIDAVCTGNVAPIDGEPVIPETAAPTAAPLPVAAITLTIPASMNLVMEYVPLAGTDAMRVLVSGIERTLKATFNAVEYSYDVNVQTVDGIDITAFATPAAEIGASLFEDDNDEDEQVYTGGAMAAGGCLDFEMWE